MNTNIHHTFVDAILEKGFDLDADIYCALMANKHQYDKYQCWWEDVYLDEISGKGYEQGGQILQNVTLTRKEDQICLDADDVVWKDSEITASSIVLYGGGINMLMATYSISYDWYCNRNFTIQWHERGIITEPYPDDPPQYLTQYLKTGGRP